MHRFLTESQQEKLREEAKRRGKQLLVTGPGDPVTAEVHIGGRLMVIGLEAGLRTVAKIAHVGLAHLVGTGIATGDAFKQIRNLFRRASPRELRGCSSTVATLRRVSKGLIST